MPSHLIVDVLISSKSYTLILSRRNNSRSDTALQIKVIRLVIGIWQTKIWKATKKDKKKSLELIFKEGNIIVFPKRRSDGDPTVSLESK